MSDCKAVASLSEDHLTCDLWDGHWPDAPHLDRAYGIHWFRTEEIPGELQREQPDTPG